MNFTILRFDSLESTNTEAVNQAKRGADEGLCIVAKRQTAGRGRHGRSWISPENAGLYFSLILHPKVENKFLSLTTFLAAIAVADVLENFYGLRPDIKWANDVLIGGRKICGILAEMIETPKGAAIVVGIGINLDGRNFPPEIADTATSIEQETGKIIEVEILLQNLTKTLTRFCEMFYGTDGAEKIRREWTRRSSYAFGKNVRVKTGTETIFGITRGIEENGALRIETANDTIKIIQAGDVSQLREAPENSPSEIEF